jgi:DNA topoisomerase-1
MKKKTLVIVESPAKSNTISRYLGSDYLVSSSMGHIRDLNPRKLSIDIENNFEPHYEELKDKKKIINELKNLSAKSQDILLAPDPDREGEAIAFHLREILKGINDRIYRIFFNEITQKSIQQAIQNPLNIDIDKFNSQQMRRILDRLAGYKISPVLQKKIGGPLSAGRVQSIALKLIVEREKEIQAFIPEEYWTIKSLLEGSKQPLFTAKLEKHKGKKIKIENKEQADQILSRLKENDYILQKIKKRSKKRRPPPPFITSSLQQEAYRRFKFSVKRTMRLAQELYEGITLQGGETTGLITYMRTDSYRIAGEAIGAARVFIEKTFGEEYYPDKPNFYSSKKKIQDAHEAIRPSLPFRQPQEIKNFLNDSQFKLYTLIWNRFMASQMREAKIEETTFEITNGDYLFIVKGEVVKFDGFSRLLKLESTEEQLPPLSEGETLKERKVMPEQHFTKPPPRYTEAGLVKVLEEKGIGRPSTYAKIIDTLGKRDYVYREEKKFVPTLLGIRVVEYLEENFKDIMKYNFTAELEKQLDMVSEGKLDWVKGIEGYYKKLAEDLGRVNEMKKIDLLIGKKCPQCGNELVKKYSHKTRGWFVGCTGYPECRYTEKVAEDDTPKKDEILEEKCPQCGQPLVKRYSPKTRQYFVGCSGYPNCKYIAASKEDLGDCPQCGKPLVKRFSRKTRRYFLGCSGYPECKYIQGRKKK